MPQEKKQPETRELTDLQKWQTILTMIFEQSIGEELTALFMNYVVNANHCDHPNVDSPDKSDKALGIALTPAEILVFSVFALAPELIRLNQNSLTLWESRNIVQAAEGTRKIFWAMAEKLHPELRSVETYGVRIDKANQRLSFYEHYVGDLLAKLFSTGKRED